MACYYDDVSPRAEWRAILDTEVKKWLDMPYDQLILRLAELNAYEVEFQSKKYQVEVELLENNAEYIHVMVAVDDGRLPAALFPLTDVFIRKKPESIKRRDR